MERIRIVTDSTADVPPTLATALGITVVPLNVHFGRETYRDGIDLTTDRFYEMLTSHQIHPTTSQPSVGTFLETYERLSAEADHIFSIHISGKLSGTLNSAQLAQAAYPPGRDGCRITVIDSKLASLGLGLVVIRAAEAVRDGATAAEVYGLVERLLSRTHVRFFVETLEYLQRGGRIGRAQALLGGILSIKPILKIEDGEVHPVEKVRTRGKAIERLVEFVGSFREIERLAIVYVNTPDDAMQVCDRVQSAVSSERIIVGPIGPVIGAHIGPGGLGVMVQAAG